LQIGIDAEIVDAKAAKPLGNEAVEIARMIGGLIRYFDSATD
jgi:hypothetical protein